uniref:Hybrid signal transduction histidine kinase M n=1 Tax=Tanacetum cinerariifolium TaxID=118510 RepID=A0A699H9B9_TANCI|nr:hybrid signal transduction histidine kinase M [Tanacetum cinerariifolium]
MTNATTPPPPPILTLVEKLYAVTNINNVVPVKLNIDELNYSSWCYFFKIHHDNFGVLKHTEGRLIKINPKTAKDAWEQVEKIFLDNKRRRTIALKGELRVIQMGDLTADAYFRKIESIVTLLNDLGSSMTDDDVVTYAINGLSEKYAQLATIIAHKDPFPNLDTMRSMVITEEMRLNSCSQPVSINANSQVLLTKTPHANRNQDSRTSRDTRTNTPQAFNTMTLQEPNAKWNVDTGASSHLNSSSTNLSNVFNSCIYPFVFVGDGKSIPITNTGHSTLTTPHRTLHLNNVLTTPKIIKKLIFVCQYVRDNKCTIEFDLCEGLLDPPCPPQM